MVTTGRACDGCTLCCKLFAIPQLQKPMGVMCQYAALGRGCTIYEQRPHVCRVSDCLWLSTPNVPEHWKPAESHMVLAGDPTGTLLSVLVDDGFEQIWRSEPYYSDLKKWSRDPRWRIQVLPPGEGWIIFPEEDLHIAERRPDDSIVGFGYKYQANSRQPAVSVRHGDGSTTEVLGAYYPLA